MLDLVKIRTFAPFIIRQFLYISIKKIICYVHIPVVS